MCFNKSRQHEIYHLASHNTTEQTATTTNKDLSYFIKKNNSIVDYHISHYTKQHNKQRLQQTNLQRASLRRTHIYHILSKIRASRTTSRCITKHSSTHNDYNKQQLIMVYQTSGEHNTRTTLHTKMQQNKQRLQQTHIYHILSTKKAADVKRGLSHYTAQQDMHRLQQTNLHQAGLHRTQVYHFLSKIGASCTTSYCITRHSRTHNDYNKQRFFIVHQKPGEHNIRTTSHTIMQQNKQRLQHIHVYHIISKKQWLT